MSKPLNVKFNQNKNIYNVKFVWKNPKEGTSILKDTMEQISQKINKDVIFDCYNLLNSIKDLTSKDQMTRLNWLQEQSAIARELNIEESQEGAMDMSKSSSQSSFLFNINSNDNVAYYLRGYKAIDKEIELIKQRKFQAFDYVEQQINILNKSKTKWLNYNLFLTQSSLLKNPNKIFSITILSGLIFGASFVIIIRLIREN